MVVLPRIAILATLLLTSGCTSVEPESASASNAASTGDDVCDAMASAAQMAVVDGSVLDIESEHAEAVERERQILSELGDRAEACATSGTNEAAVRDRACAGFGEGMADEYKARLTALERCRPPQAADVAASADASGPPKPPIGIGASAACRLASNDNIWLNASCTVSKQRLTAAFESKAVRLCDTLAKVSFSSDGKANTLCGARVIKETCGLIVSTGTQIGNRADEGKEILNAQLGAKIAHSIQRSFLSAAIGCFKEKGTAAVVEAAQDLAGKTTGEVAKSTFKTQLSKAGAIGIAVATTACSVASSQLADAVSTSRSVDYDNACSAEAFSFKNKNRVAACMKTAGSACSAYGGTIDAAALAGVEPDTAAAFFANVTGTSLSVACAAGGPATRTLCGTIHQAALQIKQALLTGTNDWATCLPTAQLGACVGTLYANWQNGGWTNHEPVEQPHGEGDNEELACCWCYKDTYQDDGFFSDSRVSHEHWFGIIQTGDFETSNCAWMERKGKQKGGVSAYSPSGHQLYWKYSQCERARVKGNRCSANEQGTIEVFDKNKKAFAVVPVAQPLL